MDVRRNSSRSMDTAWIVLAAMLAVSPMLLRGASCGHDLSFHLLNWMEVASQWKLGILRPFWCFHAAWNAGEPRFVFYPPLSWTLGAALSLLLPIALLPAAYIFIALTLCGLTMRHMLRDIVPPRTALLVSYLYLANPYALFTALERSAYAELLAAAWMPLLLRCVLRRRAGIMAIAAPVALLWLTNAPAAVAGSYTLLIAGTVRCALTWRADGWMTARSFAARATAGYALGLGLASVFLLPAIVQRRWVQVQMAVLPGLRPEDNFLFLRTGQPDHDLVLRQASWIATGTLGVGLLCFVLLMWRRTHHISWRSMHDRQVSSALGSMVSGKMAAAMLGLLLLTIAFLLTPASSFVWKYAPELSFLQFPWRFLAVGAAAVAVLIALLLRSVRLPEKTCIASGVLLALFAGWGARSLYFQSCDDEDAPSHQQALFNDRTGAEPTDEYTPSSADNDALKPGLPQAWTAMQEDDPPSANRIVQAAGAGGRQQSFTLQAAPGTNYLVVRLRQFHGWHVFVDGTAAVVSSQRNDGLLAVPLTPGTHRVTVAYRWTWDELLGLWISVTSCAAALWTYAGPKRQLQSQAPPTGSGEEVIP